LVGRPAADAPGWSAEQGFSNKRIARTLDVGGETVKWHLKNLFSKLSAVSRDHAIDRARLLGLVG